MRVKISEKHAHGLFNSILYRYGNYAMMAKEVGVSTRAINDWKNGITTIPLKVFKKLFKQTDLRGFEIEILSDYWHVKEAGKLGAIARAKLYGNFGTHEGRSRGGHASLITHKKRQTGFQLLQAIYSPKNCNELAELLGILIGDGHLAKYQVSICTNRLTDIGHAKFSRRLIKKLFGIPVSLKERKADNSVVVVASSKKLVQFLNKKGMPVGNKINSGLKIPAWVFKELDYQKSFLRGLFDTDGCIYLDKHKIGGKIYYSKGWALTSYSKPLREDIVIVLKNMGYNPTLRDTQKSVYLRRQVDIKRYFLDIGTNNFKHMTRYKNYGRVSKRT